MRTFMTCIQHLETKTKTFISLALLERLLQHNSAVRCRSRWIHHSAGSSYRVSTSTNMRKLRVCVCVCHCVDRRWLVTQWLKDLLCKQDFYRPPPGLQLQNNFCVSSACILLPTPSLQEEILIEQQQISCLYHIAGIFRGYISDWFLLI